LEEERGKTRVLQMRLSQQPPVHVLQQLQQDNRRLETEVAQMEGQLARLASAAQQATEEASRWKDEARRAQATPSAAAAAELKHAQTLLSDAHRALDDRNEEIRYRVTLFGGQPALSRFGACRSRFVSTLLATPHIPRAVSRRADGVPHPAKTVTSLYASGAVSCTL
jgi:hypothetical protein